MSEILVDLLADPAVGAAATILAVAAVACWLMAAWWAYADAHRRAESALIAYVAAGWILISTPLLLPLSLLIYRSLRPQVAAGDQRAAQLARSLASAFTELPSCPGCAGRVEEAWVRCPDCATWLAAPCASCERWFDLTFDICPWCGGDHDLPATPEPAAQRLPRTNPAPAAGSARLARLQFAGHATAAAGMPAAAAWDQPQRRVISSARPLSYAASRDTSSTPS